MYSTLLLSINFSLIIFSEIMSYPVVCVRTNEKVGFIENMLKTESHNGFPVVDVTEVRICQT